jgi:hypothetical protein
MGALLNDEKFGMLYGSHIYIVRIENVECRISSFTDNTHTGVLSRQEIVNYGKFSPAKLFQDRYYQ